MLALAIDEARSTVVDAPSADLEPGTLVADYEVVRLIGRGAMGTIYEAVHPLIERRVAIKVLRHEGASSGRSIARLLREARASNRVRHRNIVDVYSVGALDDGRLFLIMELLEGWNLQQLVDTRGPLSFQEGLVIAEATLSALSAAHEARVIHRDLKPENIVVVPGPDQSLVRASVKILDFGIAEMQAPGGFEVDRSFEDPVAGTPAFMAPEQCRGDTSLDARSDLYSFGLVLYFMFTGRLPFESGSYVELLEQQLYAAPPLPSTWVDLPRSVEEIILRLLEKEPDRRHPSAEVVRVLLRGCSDAMAWRPTRREGGEVLRAAPYERSAPGKPSAPSAMPRPLPARLPNEVPVPSAQPVTTEAPSSSEEDTAPMPALPPSLATPTMARRQGRTVEPLQGLALVLLGGGLLALAAVLLAWLALTR